MHVLLPQNGFKFEFDLYSAGFSAAQEKYSYVKASFDALTQQYSSASTQIIKENDILESCQNRSEIEQVVEFFMSTEHAELYESFKYTDNVRIKALKELNDAIVTLWPYLDCSSRFCLLESEHGSLVVDVLSSVDRQGLCSWISDENLIKVNLNFSEDFMLLDTALERFYALLSASTTSLEKSTRDWARLLHSLPCGYQTLAEKFFLPFQGFKRHEAFFNIKAVIFDSSSK